MKDDRAQGGFRRNAKPVFHDVKSVISGLLQVFDGAGVQDLPGREPWPRDGASNSQPGTAVALPGAGAAG